MSDEKEGMVVFCVALFVFALGLSVGRCASIIEFHREAVEHQAARYNPNTSAFEWINPVEKK